MTALFNAHTHRDLPASSGAGPVSDAPPEAAIWPVGVSSDYAPKPGHQWYVLRVTYNRRQAAVRMVREAQVQCYVPMHYVKITPPGSPEKPLKGKGRPHLVLEPLMPNLVFVYARRRQADALVGLRDGGLSVLKYYLNRTLTREGNGKHPPLTVPHEQMLNFIRATVTCNEHVRLVSTEQCHYRPGDRVRVVEGEFEGVVGRVARVSGQQRVVLELEGICLLATAYVPSAFLREAEAPVG